ncbi:hypothetical protein [Loktanella sp. 3ANDIMAR09]|uniref:hypothetical protein n=1 Tax=Loktanella sp. 3ANDIMAR09 TaxID=1225657 RepID=UPI000A586DE8|nr:hypothetical protein [Loktanella sp. 3ANDIMAR09]
MKILLIWVSCLMGLQSAAHAGPWPREEGHTFIAAGGNFLLSDGAELPVHYDPTLYVEYGLRPDLTVGLDFYSADKGRIYSAFSFAAIPANSPDADLKSMLSFGIGYRRNADDSEELLTRIGLSLGQSTPNGWLAFDGNITYDAIDQAFRPKADFTWGRSWSDRWTTTLQVQTGQGFSDDHYAKVSPTLIYTINERYRVNLGSVHALTGDRGSALKIETWLQF